MFRHLKQIIGQYWTKNRAPALNDIGKKYAPPLSDDERLWNKLIEAGGCEACAVLPKRFMEGPSGGINVNVFCAHCGQGYNLAPAAQWAQKIHVDRRYTVREIQSPPTRMD